MITGFQLLTPGPGIAVGPYSDCLESAHKEVHGGGKKKFEANYIGGEIPNGEHPVYSVQSQHKPGANPKKQKVGG